MLEIDLDAQTEDKLRSLAESTSLSESAFAAELMRTAVEELDAWQVEAIREGVEAAARGDTVELEAIRQRWEAKRARTADATG